MFVIHCLSDMVSSDDEDSCGSKRSYKDFADSETEEETNRDCRWTPGYEWRSFCCSWHFPWIRLPIDGAPLPIGPYRCYNTWVIQWGSNYHLGEKPIACPDFPNIADDDMFWLMFIICKCQSYGMELTGDELDLYCWMIVEASKWAVKGSGGQMD